MQHRIPCLWMRGGTSKGAYFLKEDLPENAIDRDKILLAVMGSPDPRQIDGIGGADSLTSKVAIISKSTHPNADVDYLFAQVNVDKSIVDYGQNCGNILAGVAPFAIERGLVCAEDSHTMVRVFMQNTGQIAEVLVQTPEGKVDYDGDTFIDGVPNSAAEIILNFKNIEGSTCGSLFPTGNIFDVIDGIHVTCIDYGMPVILIRAEELGCSGMESKFELDSNVELKARIEKIRLIAGPMMNLGDVSQKTVPKVSIISQSENEAAIRTRTFIPHTCHAAIGVFGATSVATACLIQGTVAFDLVNTQLTAQQRLNIEHPTGRFTVLLELDHNKNVGGCGFVRTARALFDGHVLVNIKS